MSGGTFGIFDEIEAFWNPLLCSQISRAEYLQECALEGVVPDEAQLREYDLDGRGSGLFG